jgi:hypothetical protein
MFKTIDEKSGQKKVYWEYTKSPKIEERNPKQYQNSNDQNSKLFETLRFRILNLFRNSNLEFRIYLSVFSAISVVSAVKFIPFSRVFGVFSGLSLLLSSWLILTKPDFFSILFAQCP